MNNSDKQMENKEELKIKLNDLINDIGPLIDEGIKNFENSANSWWDNLPYDDKLKAFYSITKRIHESEIKNSSSFRGVLYTGFDFDFDAYMIAMASGYMDIHNALFDARENKNKTLDK
jgi:hypothetical protein